MKEHIVGPVTVFGLGREEWVCTCAGCGRNRFMTWDVRIGGVDFNFCRKCFATIARILSENATQTPQSSGSNTHE